MTAGETARKDQNEEIDLASKMMRLKCSPRSENLRLNEQAFIGKLSGFQGSVAVGGHPRYKEIQVRAISPRV